MDPSLAQLLSSPDHYLHSFEGDQAILLPMDRAAYQRSIFLDQRISAAGAGGFRVPAALLAGTAPAAQPTDWIFHVAHCGSTLLARALDQLSGNLVLREPFALRQIALGAAAAWLDPVLALLSRRYPGQGPTLVKANVPVNFLLEPIVAADPSARAVFLWCDLPDYLLAILRSPNHRAWLRNVCNLLAIHLGGDLPKSDAEVAALLWSAQLRRFAAAIAQLPQARSLEAERFFAQPAEAVAAAAALFGYTPEPGTIETLVAGPLFNTYSKNPAHAFDNAARLARRGALAAEVAPEIEQAARWIADHAPDMANLLREIQRAELT